MSFLQQGIILLTTLILIFAFLKIRSVRINSEKKFDEKLIFKVASLVLALVFFFRYMLADEAIRFTIDLKNENFSNSFESLIGLILTWFNFVSILMLILYPFFEIKTQKNLIKVFSLPISILSLILFSIYSKAIIGATVYTNFNIRLVFIIIELIITLSYGVIITLTNKDRFTKEDIKNIFLCIIPILLAVMPCYMLEGLFGRYNSNLEIKSLTSLHRFVLYMSIALPILIYIALKKKPKNIIYFSLLFLSLGTLITFSTDFRFERFASVTQWPLHLCNTAMYIIPIVMIFKMKKLFYFTYFINVLGAFIAMVIPDYSSSYHLFSTSIWVFYVNHYIAFFMPLLLVALNVFERPKLKQFKYSMIAFFVYFVLMLIVNAWFTNYDASVDYFFLNSDHVADKLGNWVRGLRNITLSFTLNDLKFIFYPVFQVLFFIVYIIFGLGMWFIYEAGYNLLDHFDDMGRRNEKIKMDRMALESIMGGRDIMEISNEASINKLVLNNFKKKYSSSSVYAVKGINLEINAGEIFGFLGPNGAGKSSTIKCLVGIQPITEGEMYVNGYNVDTQSVMAKRQMGFVPDHYALYEKLTGREYINYIADIYKVTKEDRDKVIEKYVELFELTTAFDNSINSYSHGMKQKIAIIAAIVHNPKVWILDEPLTGLDPNSIFQVKECMKEHARNGNIVFFSSHIIDIVERICDRIAIIKKGEIVAVKGVQEILNSGETLENFYLRHINGSDYEKFLDNNEKNVVIKNEPSQVRGE